MPLRGVVAKDMVSAIVKLARVTDETVSDVVGNGIVSKDTVSAMLKLARVTDESAIQVAGYGMVSHPMTPSRAVHRCQRHGVSHDEARQ